MVTSFLLLSTVLTLTAQDKPYQYFLSGNAENVDVATRPGVLLAGGSTDVDEAFRWFLGKAGGGDIVILRASGADGYHAYLMKLAKVDSVETFLFRSQAASFDAALLEKLKHADGIFLAGGDQWNYFRFWKDTPVEKAIHEAVARGVPIGGTSAGLAVLGEFAFSAQFDTVTSETALADPFHEKVAIGTGFLELRQLQCLITDSHFSKRNRMGRLLVFLGRIRQETKCGTVHGLGIDEKTAVLLEPDGKAKVVGTESAFFLTLREKPALQRGTAASLPPVAVERVDAGGVFDMRKWSGDAAARYTLRVERGAVQSSLAGGGQYR